MVAEMFQKLLKKKKKQSKIFCIEEKYFALRQNILQKLEISKIKFWKLAWPRNFAQKFKNKIFTQEKPLNKTERKLIKHQLNNY